MHNPNSVEGLTDRLIRIIVGRVDVTHATARGMAREIIAMAKVAGDEDAILLAKRSEELLIRILEVAETPLAIRTIPADREATAFNALRQRVKPVAASA